MTTTVNLADKRERLFNLTDALRKCLNSKRNRYKISSTLGAKNAEEFDAAKQVLRAAYPDAWTLFLIMYDLPDEVTGASLFE